MLEVIGGVLVEALFWATLRILWGLTFRRWGKDDRKDVVLLTGALSWGLVMVVMWLVFIR